MPLSPPSPNAAPPDAPPRVRRSWTRAEQAAHLADFAASGLSATAFCRRLGVGRATLARWRERAAAGPTPRPARRRPGPATFAAVTVVPDAPRDAAPAPALPAPPAALSLVLRAPSGVTADVAGLDVATAAALLRAVFTPTALAAGAPPP